MVDEVVDVDPISCVAVGVVDDGVADWIWAATRMSLSFSAGVVQVISPTVNVKPGGHHDGGRKNYRLDRHRANEHTPYLARHCRIIMLGSLPRGIPKVVD